MSLRVRQRYIKRKVTRAAEEHIESIDMLVLEIDHTKKKVRGYIQNSDEAVWVRYPENLTTKPPWLKVDGSVRVNFRGGKRNTMEVVGPGHSLPTRHISIEPVTKPLSDAVLTGMRLAPVYTNPGDPAWKLSVSSGTYRYAGLIYSFSSFPMAADSTIVLSESSMLLMGEAGGFVELEPPPAVGYYRYDLVVIGIDGVLDVVKGSESTTTPSIPEIPYEHSKVGRVFMYGGATRITPKMIGVDYAEPDLASIGSDSLNVEADTTQTTAITVRVTLYDQYDNPFKAQVNLSASWVYGAGSFGSEPAGDPQTLPSYSSDQSVITLYSFVDFSIALPVPPTSAYITYKIVVVERPGLQLIGAVNLTNFTG